MNKQCIHCVKCDLVLTQQQTAAYCFESNKDCFCVREKNEKKSFYTIVESQKSSFYLITFITK